MHLPGGCGAGAGLLTFSHTVRIVSAYVSHTQTPFCAHLAILCTPREADEACAGSTKPEPRSRRAKEIASQTAKRLAGSLCATGFSYFSHSFRIGFAYSDVVWRPVGHHGVLEYAPVVLRVLVRTSPRRIPGIRTGSRQDKLPSRIARNAFCFSRL